MWRVGSSATVGLLMQRAAGHRCGPFLAALVGAVRDAVAHNEEGCSMRHRIVGLVASLSLLAAAAIGTLTGDVALRAGIAPGPAPARAP